jgi:hypothetical protein
MSRASRRPRGSRGLLVIPHTFPGSTRGTSVSMANLERMRRWGSPLPDQSGTTAEPIANSPYPASTPCVGWFE